MSYIYKVNIPKNNQDVNYLIEPLLYIEPTKNGVTYSTILSDFSLVQGVAIQVKFTNASIGNDTLSINSQVKSIYYKGSTITAGAIQADSTYTLVYNGTVWEIVGDLDTDTIYTLPPAEANVLGGIKVGYTTNDKNYKVQLDSNNNAYVNVPWTDNNDDTHRPIKVNGTQILGNNTTALNLKAGTNVQITATANSSDVTISATDTTYDVFNKSGTNHTTGLVPDPGATEGNTKFLREDGTWAVPSSGVTSVSTGAGLTGGDITSTGTIKADLTSETKLTNAAADGTETSGRIYPVRLDKNGKLAVNVPWTNENNNYLTSHASGYGQITISAQSSGVTALSELNSAVTTKAKSSNEILKFTTANKWIVVTGSNSDTAGADEIKFAHALNGITAKSSYGSTATTASANGGSITVTDIQYDEAGHITASTDRKITLSQTTYSLSGLGGIGTITASGTSPLTLSGSKSGTTYTLTGSIADASTSASGVVNTSAQTFGGIKTFDSGIHIYGSINMTGTGAGQMQHGGAYHAGHNSIILHGDSAGISGIGFTSQKATNSSTISNINSGSDRAFIQYHAYGVTAAAEGAAPSLATSGEKGTLVIGVGNDGSGANEDIILLQARGATGIKHLINDTAYPIPHTTNTNGSVGSNTTPVYVEAGIIKAGTALKDLAYIAKPSSDTTTTYLRGDGSWVGLSDMGLSNALHFIGITTTDMTGGTATNHTWTGTPEGISNYTPKQGDVVINSTKQDEWVCTSASDATYIWERLGSDTSYKIVQSEVTTVTADTTATTTFVSSVTQDANGVISVTTKPLNTSGTWSGTAAKITAGESTSNLARPVWFSYSDNGTSYINGKLGYNTNFMYNPSTGALQVGNTSTGSILVGSATASTAGTGERQVGVKNGSGRLYLYATAATNGNKGLYAYATNQSTGGAILTVNQSNEISAIAKLACSATITGTLTLSRTQDVVLTGTDATKPALIIGNDYGSQHLELDGNEIQSKTNKTTAGDLYLNNLGGKVEIGNASNSALKVAYTTDSSSTSTGALQVSGGVGIGKTLYVGTGANITGKTIIQTTASPQLQICNTATASGNDIAIQLIRGGTSANSSYASWQISIEGGDLYFKSNFDANGGSAGTSFARKALQLVRNTGAAIVTNTVTAKSFTVATNKDAIAHLLFGRSTYNYIAFPSGGELCLNGNTSTMGTARSIRIGITTDANGITSGYIYPGVTNKVALGSSDLKWSNIYATTFTGDLSGNAATATSANHLKSDSTLTYTSGLQYYSGQPTIGSADGNGASGSNANFKLWSYPADYTEANDSIVNIQSLRLYWNASYLHEIFSSPNNEQLLHRSIMNNVAKNWRVILDSGNTSAAKSDGTDISVSWNTSTKIATINGVDVKIKIPSNPNTNNAVTQNILSSETDLYPVLLSAYKKDASTTTATSVNRVQTIYVKPSTGAIYATKVYSGGTEVSVSGHTHNESNITWSNGTLYTIGDDIYIGDVNQAGHLGLKSKQAGNTGLAFIKQATANDTAISAPSGTTIGKITWDGTKFSITSTTSVDASISGTATSAGKWTTARTLTIGNKGQSVDGSSDISWSLADIGAAAAEHGTHVTAATVKSALNTGSDTTKFLNNKGEWAVPPGTYSYTLPLAASGTRGGIKIGYTESGTNYAVKLSSEKAYVTVPWTDTHMNVTLQNTTTTSTYIYFMGFNTAPTSTATAKTGVSSTSMWANAVDKGKFELVLGNSTSTANAGGQFGQLALYSASSAGTYLKAADGTSWTTATLQAKTGTIALTSDIPTNLNQLTNGPGYVTSSGVTKVSTGAGLTGGDITATGTVKANLTSETKLTNAAADGTETSGRVYPVRLDKNGKLAVNVPWTNVNSSYLPLSGGTLSNTSTTFSSPILTVKNTSDAQWIPTGGFIAPNIATSHWVAIEIGKALEDKNCGHLSFYYAGNKSTSNRFELGFYSVTSILNVRADKKVGINTTAPSHDLSVNGDTASTTFIVTDGASTPNDKVTLEWNSTDQSLDFIFA